jgi:multiple sugar transport system ATP-binding protein
MKMGVVLMVQITLQHLYKQYDNAEEFSVTDFNLTIADREFIVFVGPSGCGKSTTLRMIAGLEEISAGELRMGKDIMNDVAPKDRNIAMVFQNYALYPHMTVFNNMAFGLKLRKYNKEEIKLRVANAAGILGLTDYLDRKPAALSGGQRQRVALGRAIVRDAKVFLMDEPLSNLDAKLRVSMRAEIAKLHRRLHTTTIYVTHDQTEAMTMADRIVIMKAGVVQQIGAPAEVYNHPHNKFVASFIGSPAMNFFEVVYDKGLISDGGQLQLHLPVEQIQLLSTLGYDGKTITMGIRPEDIHEATVDDSNFSLQAEVVVSELLGAETILYTRIAETEFISRIDSATTYQPGEFLQLKFDLRKAHFFDIESETCLTSGK